MQGRKLSTRHLALVPIAKFAKSLTVNKKKTIISSRCDVAHELTSRTYGKKKWWVVIVKNKWGFSRRETHCVSHSCGGVGLAGAPQEWGGRGMEDEGESSGRS